MKNETIIEFPSQGQTYCHQEFGVYEYGIEKRNSVRAGLERRVFLDSFETLAEALRAFPNATVTRNAIEQAKRQTSGINAVS